MGEPVIPITKEEIDELYSQGIDRLTAKHQLTKEKLLMMCEEATTVEELQMILRRLILEVL